MLDWATIRYHRGDAERAIELAAPIAAWGESARLQTEGVAVWARMIVALAEAPTPKMRSRSPWPT